MRRFKTQEGPPAHIHVVECGNGGERGKKPGFGQGGEGQGKRNRVLAPSSQVFLDTKGNGANEGKKPGCRRKFRLRQWKESICAIHVICLIRGSDCGAIQDAKRAQSMSWNAGMEANEGKKPGFGQGGEGQGKRNRVLAPSSQVFLDTKGNGANEGKKPGCRRKFRLRQWKESICAIHVICPIRGSDCGAIQDAKRASCPQSMSWNAGMEANEGKKPGFGLRG